MKKFKIQSHAIPLRLLFASHSELLAPILRIVHRTIISAILDPAVIANFPVPDEELASLTADRFSSSFPY